MRITSTSTITRAVRHLRALGLSVVCGDYRIPHVRPFFANGGCWIDSGVLYVRPSYANLGEFLHEAGHLALAPRSQWATMSGNVGDLRLPLGSFAALGDMAVEAWDYAIALELGLDPCLLFINGFGGSGQQVYEAFEDGFHPGFALLRALGMSPEFGQLDRHLIGTASIPEGEVGIQQFMALASRKEVRGLDVTASRLLIGYDMEIPKTSLEVA